MSTFFRSLTLRWLAAFAIPLAMLAALLPAQHTSAGAAQGTTVAASFQIYLCPLEYTGEDYLDDCTVSGEGDFDVSVTDDLAGGTTTNSTNGAGLVNYDLNAGDYTFTLEVPGDFARFYYACFDGAGVYQFDGTANQIAQTFGTGDTLSCRWYVTPEDSGAPSPSPAPSQGTATVFLGVFTCPVAYTGNDYRADCTPAQPGIPILYGDTVPLDEATAKQTATLSDTQNDFGGLSAGPFSVAVAIPGEFADFYHVCFDANLSSGAGDFLFDGDTNMIEFDLADGATLSCTLYVIPEDLSGQSASPSAPASAAPSAPASVASSPSPRPSSSGPISVLPSTGTGTGPVSSFGSIVLALLTVLAVAGVAITVRRLSSARR